MRIGDWTVSSKEHLSLYQAIPKVYTTTFKMCKPRLVTKLEEANGCAQVCANQYVVGILLLISGICCRYNGNRQDKYAMMQDKNCVTLLCQTKDQSNDDCKNVFEALIRVVKKKGGTLMRQDCCSASWK